VVRDGAAPRRTQQRSLDRRRRLASVAGQLIAERGFDSLSVSELAERCGISVGGMYRHIRSKVDVLVMACESIYGDVPRRLREAAAGQQGAPARLRAAIDVYLAACDANRDQILLLYREYGRLPSDAQHRYMDRERAVAEVFAELIAEGVAEGVVGAVDPLVAAEDIVLLGHLPALKGWALRGHLGAMELAALQRDLLLSMLTRVTPPTAHDR